MKTINNSKIQKIKEQLRSNLSDIRKLDPDTPIIDRITNRLLRSGWQIIGEGSVRVVFGKNDVDYVVKIGYGSTFHQYSKHPKKIKHHAVKEIPIMYRKDYVHGSENQEFVKVKIQPKINTQRADRALDLLSEKIGEKLWDYDAHAGNVGWHGNKPVLIDY